MHITERADFIPWQIEWSGKSVLEILDTGSEEEVLELKNILDSKLPEEPEKLYQDCVEKYETAKNSEELLTCAEILGQFKNYRDSRKLWSRAIERVEKLREKELDEYNRITTLSNSVLASNVETALELMKKSSIPQIKKEDIIHCEERLKKLQAKEKWNKVAVPVLSSIGIIILFTVMFLMMLNQ